MGVVPTRIDTADDSRLADYVRLTDVALRATFEPEHGLYIAESAKVIRRALAAGHRVRSMVMSDEWVDRMADVVDLVQAQGAPVYVADRALLEQVAGFRVHRGALASMHRPPLASVAEVVAGARRVVVLESIVDHTNVGAIFRSVAAIGADAVLISPECADPLYRRSVRVSMGAVFAVPWTRIEAWPQALSALRADGFTVAALALSDGAVDLDVFAAAAPQRLALVLGTEGDGLSARAVEQADVVVRIPMHGGIDSLNVAAASAVALWALRGVRHGIESDTMPPWP